MQVNVLGCAGGLACSLETTSFLLDETVLLDGGTGVAALSSDAFNRISSVLLTHAHLDHIAGLALRIADLNETRQSPLTIYAPEPVIRALKSHIFNWVIWPDFTQIPTSDAPVLQLNAIAVGEPFTLLDRYEVVPIELNHTVDSFAYRIAQGDRSFCFCGDTADSKRLTDWLSHRPVDDLFIELSYANADAELGSIAKHLIPDTLSNLLNRIASPTNVHIMHLKPGAEAQIKSEMRSVIRKSDHKIDYCDDLSDICI